MAQTSYYMQQVCITINFGTTDVIRNKLNTPLGYKKEILSGQKQHSVRRHTDFFGKYKAQYEFQYKTNTKNKF
jgi:hypothetical protein